MRLINVMSFHISKLELFCPKGLGSFINGALQEFTFASILSPSCSLTKFHQFVPSSTNFPTSEDGAIYRRFPSRFIVKLNDSLRFPSLCSAWNDISQAEHLQILVLPFALPVSFSLFRLVLNISKNRTNLILTTAFPLSMQCCNIQILYIINLKQKADSASHMLLRFQIRQLSCYNAEAKIKVWKIHDQRRLKVA